MSAFSCWLFLLAAAAGATTGSVLFTDDLILKHLHDTPLLEHAMVEVTTETTAQNARFEQLAAAIRRYPVPPIAAPLRFVYTNATNITRHINMTAYQHFETEKSTAATAVLVQFTAFNRFFSLHLRSDTLPIVNAYTKIEVRQAANAGSDTVTTYDQLSTTVNYYYGYDESDPVSIAHGTVDMARASFEGIVYADNEKFYIQSSTATTLSTGKSTAAASLVYRESDVRTTMSAALEALTNNTRHNCQKHKPQSSDTDDTRRRRRRKKRQSDDYDYFNEDSQDDAYLNFPRLKVCNMTIVGDVNFYQDVCGQSMTICIQKILFYIIEADMIFVKSDFTFDLKPDHLGLAVGRIVLFTSQQSPLYPSVLSQHQYTNDAASDVYIQDLAANPIDSQSCIILWMNNYNFYPTLGIAYIGGMCDTGGYNQGMVTFRNRDGSLLPAMTIRITVAHEIGHLWGSSHDPLQFDTLCAPAASTVSSTGTTTAATGAAATSGNFLMYAAATSGVKPNNDMFSLCSQDSVFSQIELLSSEDAVGGHSPGCLQTRTLMTSAVDPGLPVESSSSSLSYSGSCGDGIVNDQLGELCDPGTPGDPTITVDACCMPPGIGTGCRLKSQAQCSAREPCCNATTCQVKNDGEACMPLDACRQPSHCDGVNSRCVQADNYPDGTVCENGRRMCAGGKCKLSRCEQLSMTECACSDTFQPPNLVLFGNVTIAYGACRLCCFNTTTVLCTPIPLAPVAGRAAVYLGDSAHCMSGKGLCRSVKPMYTTSNLTESWCVEALLAGSSGLSSGGAGMAVDITQLGNNSQNGNNTNSTGSSGGKDGAMSNNLVRGKYELLILLFLLLVHGVYF